MAIGLRMPDVSVPDPWRRILENLDRQERREQKRWYEHHRAFTVIERPDRDGQFAGQVVDPRAADPAEAAAAAEQLGQVEDEKRRRGFVIRKPTLILGIQTPMRPHASGCPSCGGKRLPVYAYCAAEGCDRSGVDNVLPNVPPAERPKTYEPDPQGLAGGRGTKGRKRRKRA